jgi:2-oxo-3-hexenedioate decarboxylase
LKSPAFSWPRWTGRRQIAPLSDGNPAFDLASAYRVAAAMRDLRQNRGERVVGRKIGFTNTTIWAEYGVQAPIWGYVYDSTLHRLADLDAPFSLSTLAEPRIEPEIVFGLARLPEPDMDEAALLTCIEWVAHGFEIVQSHYPAWRFTAADTVAAFGLHGALLLGPPEPITAANADGWLRALASFDISLERNGRTVDEGNASNVLGGGPLAALRHLVGVLAHDPDNAPLAAGEIVSTGTLTRALPVAAGETWSTSLAGLPLSSITATFA